MRVNFAQFELLLPLIAQFARREMIGSEVDHGILMKLCSSAGVLHICIKSHRRHEASVEENIGLISQTHTQTHTQTQTRTQTQPRTKTQTQTHTQTHTQTLTQTQTQTHGNTT